ncbi:TonB-dependent receptor plug domain-containing protein [Pseudoalteromonas fenneropenaei]|uniref:TonB-dependent receptor plug domain-containing protein n=1 Tax=Pseudoalteromonas fenneropenaei TaxID=1737459 RepID=A0ABV7CJ28_9GAMM
MQQGNNMPTKKYGLTALTLALATAYTSSSYVYAAEENADKVERIEVTGSRIKRTDMEGPSPIQSIGKDQIASYGYDNLQQLLEKMPVAGSGTFSTRGNNQDSTANGGAAVSLRGLGPDATLVLINGRRASVSAFAESITNSFVDINSIPVSAIERIDILKDGASAIYGSDAVAGVVNVILKKDFDGMEVNLGYGGTDGPSYEEKTASLLWGSSTDDSNVTIILDYFNNSSLSSNEAGTLGTANQTPYGGKDFRSSRGFPGFFVVDGKDTIDPACPADRVADDFCLFDYGPFGYIIPEAERVGAIVQAEQKFANGMTGFVEFAVQHNTSVAAGAPTPLDQKAGLTVPGSHPNNPYGKDIKIGRYRTVDAGARGWDISSDTLRIVAGLRGTINDWDWEVAAQKGRSKSEQTGSKEQGWVRVDYLQAEIDAGNYNPFGGTYNSKEVIDRITTSLVRRGESHMTSYDASITGEAFTFNDMPVMMAAGLEYREEDVSDAPDDQFIRGLIFGTESIAAAAERDQWAAYVEFSIPLSEQFELQLAGRYDDYSDFGSTANPKVAFRWTPHSDVTVRGSWAQGFRAPSLAQIGLGPSEESVFFEDQYRCAATGKDCGPLDYNIEYTGNADLEAEESESMNLGIFWAPSAELGFGVDVWSITQDNKIDKGPYGPIYDAECNNQNSTICLRLAPEAGQSLGVLDKIRAKYKNVTSQDASGVDVSANYLYSMGDNGDLKFNLEYSYLDNFEKDDLDYTGEYGYPQHRWVLTNSWMLDNMAVNLNISYIGEFEDQPDFDFDGTLDFEQHSTRKVDSQILLDLQGSYRLNDGVKLVLGVNNLLDEEPPFAIGNGDDDLYGYVGKVHNPRGRYIYTKVTFSF